MAYQSRARKRVRANPLRRAPDGSAFQQCESCGTSVAIALVDMHECGTKENAKKKLKTQSPYRTLESHQPRSPFHFFMEEFLKTCTEGSLIEKDKKGCETWKNMSSEERQPYVDQAAKVDLECLMLSQKEENEIQAAARVDLECLMQKEENEIQWAAKVVLEYLMLSRKEENEIQRVAKVVLEYLLLSRKEENEIQRVDDEADSAEVGKYDKVYEDSMINCYDSESSYWSLPVQII